MTPSFRVLVVEDDANSQQIIGTILRSLGHAVTACFNGQEALDVCLTGEAAFDVVLMDLQMPVLDGLEATRRLRAHPATRELPIVALSAKAGSADRLACQEAGCDLYLSKPFDYDALLAIMGQALAARGQHREPV